MTTRCCLSCSNIPVIPVDVTDAFLLITHHHLHTTNQQLLLQSLCRYGWCRIVLNVDKLPTSHEFYPILKDFVNWKSRFVQIFDNDATVEERNDATIITYRSTESGDPKIVEPKQSYELRAAHVASAESTVGQQLASWLRLLQAIAQTVVQSLNLPLSVLAWDNNNNSNLDLLRAFYYETTTTVSTTTTNNNSMLLGSSPHTDWGSLTVVWQDQVGGLQTACPYCDRWIDVDCKNGSDSCEFVVHVGDLLSLAVGEAAAATVMNTTTSAGDPNVLTPFPSPKHRVLSPTTERRASLVYFAYPSSKQTFQGLVHDLIPWCRQYNVPKSQQAVLLDNYYLLRNQNDGSSLPAAAQLEKIRNQPLESVLRDKWNQVQRL